MKLDLKRQPTEGETTLGELSADGLFECYTLEDVVREVPGEPVSAWKVPGATAIPRGRYRVIVSFSPHFQIFLPLLVDVPGFTGIRIHPGNTAKDTEGCILVGDRYEDGCVLDSRKAFAILYGRIKEARARGEDVWIAVA